MCEIFGKSARPVFDFLMWAHWPRIQWLGIITQLRIILK
jgi:hypothetical protein